MLKNINERVKEITVPSKNNLSELHATLKERQGLFNEHRTDEEQEALKKFSVLLNAWGMEEEQIPFVINELEFRCIILLLPMIMCLIIILLFPAQLKLMLIVTSLIMAACIFAIMTAIWRISILKKREFIPFSKWLLCLLRLQKRTQG